MTKRHTVRQTEPYASKKVTLWGLSGSVSLGGKTLIKSTPMGKEADV